MSTEHKIAEEGFQGIVCGIVRIGRVVTTCRCGKLREAERPHGYSEAHIIIEDILELMHQHDSRLSTHEEKRDDVGALCYQLRSRMKSIMEDK